MAYQRWRESLGHAKCRSAVAKIEPCFNGVVSAADRDTCKESTRPPVGPGLPQVVLRVKSLRRTLERRTNDTSPAQHSNDAHLTTSLPCSIGATHEPTRVAGMSAEIFGRQTAVVLAANI